MKELKHKIYYGIFDEVHIYIKENVSCKIYSEVHRGTNDDIFVILISVLYNEVLK